MALPPSSESRVLSAPANLTDPALRALYVRLAGFIDNQPAQFTIQQVGPPTRYEFQAVDRLRRPWKQRFIGVVYLSSAEDGPPAAASGWLANNGVNLQALTGTPLQGFIVLTDANGLYKAKIEFLPPATDFWLHASVLGRFVGAGPFQA